MKLPLLISGQPTLKRMLSMRYTKISICINPIVRRNKLIKDCPITRNRRTLKLNGVSRHEQLIITQL